MQENVIAKKYARALEKLVDSNGLSECYEYYNEISKAFYVEKFSAIVYSHIISKAKKLELLKSFTTKKINKNGERLLEILVRNDRISLLPFLSLELKRLIDSKKNEYSATLYFKENVSEDSIKVIANKLGKKLKTTLNITQRIDTSLDGIRLEVPDLGYEVVFLKDRFLQDLQDSILKAI